MITKILNLYGFNEQNCLVNNFGNGLINNTWIVECNNQKYIFQKINDAVFKAPNDIAFNISLIDDYLKQRHKEYYFVSPLKTESGEPIVYLKNEGYYRAFPFVKGSRSIDVVQTPRQAFEAAKQFGLFTNLLSGIDISKLKITLPSFHDLSLRYQQFLKALKDGNTDRISNSNDLIEQLSSYSNIAAEYENIKKDAGFKLRVTHHDTKISNVLFDNDDNAICVIDLDTVMPGYFISDVGDMMRTYLCPVSEEEKDFSKIGIRDDFYKAIVNGYRDEMENELTAIEKKYFFYAGTFMIYMQALRFLTDYLNNDIYYGQKYEGHNFVRAQNQCVLLEKLLDKKNTLSAY